MNIGIHESISSRIGPRTLNAKPSTLNRSYVEDIAMVRGDTISTPGFLNSNYEPPANDVQNMFIHHDEEGATSSKDGLFGWIGGMCFGPRKVQRNNW